MGLERQFRCDGGCGAVAHETQYGSGAGSGWAKFEGVWLNGVSNPFFCPECTSVIMGFIDEMATANRERGNDVD